METPKIKTKILSPGSSKQSEWSRQVDADVECEMQNTRVKHQGDRDAVGLGEMGKDSLFGLSCKKGMDFTQ